MNSNPQGAVLVRTKPALASKTPVYSSRATVACAHRCSSIAFQVAFARNLTNAQTKVKTVQTLTTWEQILTGLECPGVPADVTPDGVNISSQPGEALVTLQREAVTADQQADRL